MKTIAGALLMGTLLFILSAVPRTLQAEHPAHRSSTIVGVTETGSPVAPNGGMREAGILYALGDMDFITDHYLDSANGMLYCVGTPSFPTHNQEPQVIKIDAATDPSHPQWSTSMRLRYEDGKPLAIVVDETSGIGFVGTDGWTGTPGRIIKFFSGEGNEQPGRGLTYESLPDEYEIHDFILDAEHGLLYTETSNAAGRVVKIVKFAVGAANEPVRRIGAFTFPIDSRVGPGLLSPDGMYALYPVDRGIMKLYLGTAEEPPSMAGQMTLAPSGGFVSDIFRSADEEYLFATVQQNVFNDTVLLQLCKLSFSNWGAIPIPSTQVEFDINAGPFVIAPLVDSGDNLAVISQRTINSSKSTFTRVHLGTGSAAPQVTDTIELDENYGVWMGWMNPQANLCGFIASAGSTSRKFVTMNHGGSSSDMAFIAESWAELNEHHWHDGKADSAGLYAYATTTTETESIDSSGLVKLEMRDGDSLPRRIGGTRFPDSTLALASGIDNLRQVSITSSVQPDEILKTDLGDSSQPPSYLSNQMLEGSNAAGEVLVDEANGFAYMGLLGSVFTVRKIAIGETGDAPHIVSSLVVPSIQTGVLAGAIDAKHGFAYFAGGTSSSMIAKVRLEDGDTTPTLIGTIPLASEFNYPTDMAADIDAGTLYLSCSSGRVLKVAMGEGDAFPSIIGSATLPGTPWQNNTITLDAEREFAYVGTDSSTSGGSLRKARAYRIGLGGPSDPPMFDGMISFSDFAPTTDSWIDSEGSVYFSRGTFFGGVAKVVTDKGRHGLVNAMKVELKETTVGDGLHFHFHSPSAPVRFGIYQGIGPMQLIWESELLVTPATRSELLVQTGGVLMEPGTYWLAWQTDSVQPVGSYSEGTEGSGFTVLRSFGPFPETLLADDTVPNSDLWTLYLTTSGQGATGWNVN